VLSPMSEENRRSGVVDQFIFPPPRLQTLK
jgi:hypothetical protein